MSSRSIEGKRQKAKQKSIKKLTNQLVDQIGRTRGINALKCQARIIQEPVSESRLKYMDETLLGEDGFLQVLPEALYYQFTIDELAMWCAGMGYWIMPTVELIECITQEMIGTGLEICAGSGVIGRALGIRSIDLKMSQYRFYRELFRSNNMCEPHYGEWVEEAEAGMEIQKTKPDTVVGGYVIPRGADRAFWGINEDILLKSVRKVILIQPFDMLSNAFRRKAREININVISKNEKTKMFVYDNPNPLPCPPEDPMILRMSKKSLRPEITPQVESNETCGITQVSRHLASTTKLLR